MLFISDCGDGGSGSSCGGLLTRTPKYCLSLYQFTNFPLLFLISDQWDQGCCQYVQDGVNNLRGAIL